jgi:LacI family transcriptional regulator
MPGGNGKRKATTLADVARAANVSLATASKALNDHPVVKDSTKQRIRAAARDLHFEHNALARSLTSGRSGTVGMLTSDLEGRFCIPILTGAEDSFGVNEVSVLVSDSRGDRIREARHIQILGARQIDALMVVGSRCDPRPTLGDGFPFPILYVYTPSASPDDASLTPDNVQAGRIAAEHLLDTGRRRILHIRGTVDEAAAADRATGIDEVLAGAGLAVAGRTGYGEWTERWGRAATLMALDAQTGFDAIVADSDEIARGCLDALSSRGVAVPADVALLGFDNWELLTADANPPITSVDMNLQQMGDLAARLLYAAVDGEPLTPGVRYLPCRLVVRNSTTR